MIEKSSSRSVLYNIKPIGIKTGLVESLSSYLMRVAYEHNVTIGHLINKMIIPQMNKDYLKRSSKYGGNRFYEGAKTINGYMENATELVRVMEVLTNRNDLSDLTLYKFNNFIPLRNLLKESFSWCPDCIRSSRENERIIYYPLIWYIKSVEVCVEHNRYLVEKCPTCNKKVDVLRRKMIPGHCPNCLTFLGQDTSEEEPEQQEMNWQTFILQNIEEMISMKQNHIFVNNPKDRIVSQLNLINLKYFSSNIAGSTSSFWTHKS